jgi:hypothetical protein
MIPEEFVELKCTNGKYKINRLGQITRDGIKILRPGLNGNGYPFVTLYVNKTIKLCKQVHRAVAETFIPNPSNKSEVNHIDGNKQNYSIDNLEWVTRSENSFWAKKRHIKSSSKYKGVSWHGQNKCWQASITYDYKKIYLGCYEKEEDAAKAYNKKAKELFGKFALLNIIAKDQEQKKVNG